MSLVVRPFDHLYVELVLAEWPEATEQDVAWCIEIGRNRAQSKGGAPSCWIQYEALLCRERAEQEERRLHAALAGGVA